MLQYLKRQLTLFLSLIILFNFNPSFALDFNDDLREIRAEINRDNLQEAIKKIKSLKISNENDQEKIDLLFGDIYLKINQIDKAEEFYQKTFFTSDEDIEAMMLIGLAEVRLAQGKLDDAINYAERSIKINSNKIRPKIILAIAKTRLGESEEGFNILNELYLNRKDSEVALAISSYFSSLDETKRAIEVLEEYIKRDPNNIKVLNELSGLYLFDGDKEKAIEYKFIVYKYYEFNRNKKKQKQAKAWILSVDPKYFDKPIKIKKPNKKNQKNYEEEEITNYEENKNVPDFEEFAFAPNSGGSGFIIGDGKYVITNNHVIENAEKIAVRNGLGEVRNAKVFKVSKNYDLAILQLENSYDKKYSIKNEKFIDPVAGEDVIILGYPAAGLTYDYPTITEGIVSKVFVGEGDGIFLTSATVNPGNSGGPVINLKGDLIGVIFAATNLSEVAKATGVIETAMGFGVSSNKIQEVFNYKQTVPVKKTNFNKSSLYEKMLPHVVNVATYRNEN